MVPFPPMQVSIVVNSPNRVVHLAETQCPDQRHRHRLKEPNPGVGKIGRERPTSEMQPEDGTGQISGAACPSGESVDRGPENDASGSLQQEAGAGKQEEEHRV